MTVTVTRTSAGLRDALFEELEALRNGTSDPKRAHAVAKLASAVIDTVRLEMQADEHLRRQHRTAYNPETNEIADHRLPAIALTKAESSDVSPE